MSSMGVHAVLHQIVADVEAELLAQQSSLLEDELIAAQMQSQLYDILNDVVAYIELAAAQSADSIDGESRQKSREIGRFRATQAVHPSDSLEAANVLFRIALPALIDAYTSSDARGVAPDAMLIANELHSAIMARITPASIGYVEVLVKKLSVAQSEERVRISRELHDRVAHGIAAGIQRISLAEQSLPSEGSDMLISARNILREALMDTRRIAIDLRQVAAGRTLDTALSEYVSDLEGFGDQVRLESRGIPLQLPAVVSEEAFLIVREAIRNASIHAGSERTDVKLAWGESEVVITVSDDGVGFDTSRIRPNTMGLISMHERAEIIGGEVRVHSIEGSGTIVSLEIALDRVGLEG